MLLLALQRGPWWCPMCGSGGGWAMMMGMMAFWLLVIVAIAVVAYGVSRGRWGGGPPHPPASAEDILKARYARGEIDGDTYRRMRDELREPAGSGRP